MYGHIYISIYVYILTVISNDVLTGADIASGPVWMDYISFLKSLPVCLVNLPCLVHFLVHNLVPLFISFGQIQLQTGNLQEETHRMTNVRKVYQKAIVTPTHHIEQLWRDYENFENSVSRQLVIYCYSYLSVVVVLMWQWH